ncbi:GNAT family N-acetyltransferase [Hyphomonas sp.]|uniref:GNAT family N-acetyltransferase n=1 Tax=Hyphomonas sp. TaxID=87 RepID=UPI00333EE5C8
MKDRSVIVQLDSGETVCLRPVRREDNARLRAGIAALSDHSRYLRFFTGARTVPDDVVSRLCDADGSDHVAWGAIDLEAPGQPAIGVVHAIRRSGSNEADLALAVLDDWHGKGIARLLLTAVIDDARDAGIRALTADTLAENRAAQHLFRCLGGLSVHREGPVISYRFDIETAARKLATMTPGAAGDGLRTALMRSATPRRWARPG